LITYRFARGASGQLVDVAKLSEQTRRIQAPYHCFGCNGELIANLPISKSQYFSHKSSELCSFETYLHSLAKNSFMKHYEDALHSGTPFFLEVKYPAECHRHLEDLGHVCKTTAVRPFDLTSVYKYASLETEHNGFRPDVLLTSDTAPPLFIEIAVTHKCSVEKLASGIRILEIQINSETDLVGIEQRRLLADEQLICTYNFKRKTVSGDVCEGNCNTQGQYFLTYRSGKARIAEGSLDEIAEQAKRAYACKPVVETENGNISSTEVFLTNVRHYYFNGVPIKNCVLCRHHRIPDEGPLICGLKRIRVNNTNDAAACSSFAPFSSEKECQEAEQANLQQVRTRGEALAKRMIGNYY
jgi:hypothetical protein